MNNIAGGFERRTDNELRHFLFVAKGSCGEVKSMLLLAKEPIKISEENFEVLVIKYLNVSKLLYGFIKSPKNF